MSEINALEAMLQHYQAEKSAALLGELKPVFADSGNFLDKVSAFDQVLARYPEFEAIHEYLFDLLMVHHLSNFIEDESYLDSKEWLDIEDKTLERGTEMLNILLYISESEDSDVSVSIDDFLYEFLLVDEDEFQDEHRIYEVLISNQDLVDEDLDNILDISKSIDEDNALKELFTPMMVFFQDPKARLIAKDTYSKLKPIERALLSSMLAYQS